MGEAHLASLFPNLFRCAGDCLVLVRDCFSKNGEHVVWGPIFRRDLSEGEIVVFAALLSILNIVYIVDRRKDRFLHCVLEKG